MKKTENVLKELYQYLGRSINPDDTVQKIKTRATTWLMSHAQDYDFSNITFEGTYRIVGYGLDSMKNSGYYDETIIYANKELLYMKGMDIVYASDDYSICMTLPEAQKVRSTIKADELDDLLTLAVRCRNEDHFYMLPLSDEMALLKAYFRSETQNLINTLNSKVKEPQQKGCIVLLRINDEVKPSSMYYEASEQDAITCIKTIAKVKQVEQLDMVGEYEYNAPIPGTRKKGTYHFKIVMEP